MELRKKDIGYRVPEPLVKEITGREIYERTQKRKMKISGVGRIRKGLLENPAPMQ